PPRRSWHPCSVGSDMTAAIVKGPPPATPPASPAAGKAREAARTRLWVLATSPTLRVIGRRLFFGVVLVFVVTGISFLLVALIPGDPARAILGVDATPAQVAQLRHEL